MNVLSDFMIRVDEAGVASSTGSALKTQPQKKDEKALTTKTRAEKVVKKTTKSKTPAAKSVKKK
jgi:hypothetical protein